MSNKPGLLATPSHARIVPLLIEVGTARFEVTGISLTVHDPDKGTVSAPIGLPPGDATVRIDDVLRLQEGQTFGLTFTVIPHGDEDGRGQVLPPAGVNGSASIHFALDQKRAGSTGRQTKALPPKKRQATRGLGMGARQNGKTSDGPGSPQGPILPPGGTPIGTGPSGIISDFGDPYGDAGGLSEDQ
jgi:hypothetical protein